MKLILEYWKLHFCTISLNLRHLKHLGQTLCLNCNKWRGIHWNKSVSCSIFLYFVSKRKYWFIGWNQNRFTPLWEFWVSFLQILHKKKKIYYCKNEERYMHFYTSTPTFTRSKNQNKLYSWMGNHKYEIKINFLHF